MNRVITAGAIAVLGVATWGEVAAGQGRAQQRPGMGPPPSVAVAESRLPQGFSVVLVLGDLQGGTTQDNVPPAARKALNDMKDFLPYKSYRLLDVQWTLCCGGRAATPVVSRLRGPDGHDFELTLTSEVQRPRLAVRFVLREPSGANGEAGSSDVLMELYAERERLEMEYETLRKGAQRRFEVGTGKPPDEDPEIRQARAKLAEFNIRLARERQKPKGGGSKETSPDHRSRPMIDTSFTMDVGETVVVGTSRLAGGDKALIALLTAVPRNPGTK
jgi:hypothetical protein